ncbi:FAD-dependent monooxygenase [Lentzea tibetensis]|uniref:FAD-dependent monooxygenase n=1 Tax=Lentzea tibetensis TaxID=2591470 RepID=UPI001646E6BE|nr:FAD-dependent monooxygenase [Lentzea tibetensis]
MDTDVIVVGAGPVGLLLAGELRLGGAEVVVVERLARPTTESRASTLHARTAEVFDQRGLLEPLGDPPRDAAGHFGGIPLDLGDLPSPHAGIWKVPQTRVEELLAQWAAGLGADIRRNHELTGLVQHDDHVEAHLTSRVTLRASYVVGCDGERSAVRRLAGFAFPGAAASREMLRADVAGIDVPARRFERLPGGLAVSARRPDGVTRVMVHRYGEPPAVRTGEPAFAEVAERWAQVTGEDISGGTPLWVNAFDDTSRQAASYLDRRVFLAGDAAHVQMPVGGQALNLGLQDAANLGWKLAAAVAGHAPAALLDTYHHERHPVGQRVLTNIRAQAHVLLGAGEVGPVRSVLAELLRFEPVRAHLAGMISGLDVRYDAGPGDHPLVGMRVPPTEFADGTSTTRLLRSGRGVLIDLADRRTDISPWADRVLRAVARPPAGSPLDDLTAVLLRPDGHVAWTGGTEPEKALRRWFGEPQTGDGQHG